MADTTTDLSLIIPDETKPDDQPTLSFGAELNAALIETNPATQFPATYGQRWWDSSLEGVPFLIAGKPVLVTVPDNFNEGATKEEYVVPVRLFEPDGHRSPYTIEWHAQGAWVMGSIRNLLAIPGAWAALQDNPRMVWTLARQPQSEVNKSTHKRSLDLARYTEGVQEVVAPPSTFDAPPTQSYQPPQTLPEFLSAAAALNPVFKDHAILMAVLGVKSLRSANYPQSYEVLVKHMAKVGGA